MPFSRQQKRRDVARVSSFGEMDVVVINDEQRSNPRGKLRAVSHEISQFPQRPDPTVLNEAIPLFFIARNKSGFWIARDVEGRNGGIFLLKRSQLRFARKKSEPAGCATMLLNEPHELDVKNQGRRFVILVSVATDALVQRGSSHVAFISIMREVCRRLSRIFRTSSLARVHKAIKRRIAVNSTFL